MQQIEGKIQAGFTCGLERSTPYNLQYEKNCVYLCVHATAATGRGTTSPVTTRSSSSVHELHNCNKAKIEMHEQTKLLLSEHKFHHPEGLLGRSMPWVHVEVSRRYELNAYTRNA